MEKSKNALPTELRKQLIDYCYPIIACIHETHRDLGPGMPEYIYQEALEQDLTEHGFDAQREYQHHPTFHGRELDSFQKMDILVSAPEGNVIIECKALTEMGIREQYQTWGYLRGTEYPIAILVNFGTWPKAQIERYYYDKLTKSIHAF